MSKIAFVFFIVCVLTAWGINLNCQSCGFECSSACGTRYFRTCCFNYLRRKRGSNEIQYSPWYNVPYQNVFEDLSPRNDDMTELDKVFGA